MSLDVTDCPKCFDRPGQPCGIPVLLPNGDGTYTRHRQRSVYTHAEDRPCEWQEQDHADRVQRLLTGNY